MPRLGHSMTPLMLNGPLGAKITIAVVDGGFAAQDQDSYDRTIDNLLTNGLFAQLPEHHLALVPLKNRDFDGCGDGGRATLPPGITWLAIAHEFGHAAWLGITEHGGERRFGAGESRQCAQRRAVAAPPRAQRHSGRVAHQSCRHASADITAANHRIQLDGWEFSWS